MSSITPSKNSLSLFGMYVTINDLYTSFGLVLLSMALRLNGQILVTLTYLFLMFVVDKDWFKTLSTQLENVYLYGSQQLLPTIVLCILFLI